MSSINKQENKQGQDSQDGEIDDAALGAVSGGQNSQPIQKLETMVVTATRLPPSNGVFQKMDPIVVTATRLPPDTGGSQVAVNTAASKKGS